ncbi:MAG: AMP-binding protein [Gammaproteobacteria bacterium]
MNTIANAKPLLAEQLLTIVYELLGELNLLRAQEVLTINSSLTEDLGLDSLAKTELIHRVEKQCQVQLPAQLLAEAVTLNDILCALSVAANQHTSSTTYTTFTRTASLHKIHTDVSTLQTYNDVLCFYAQHVPQRPHVYLLQDQAPELVLTYGELFQQARTVAANLQSRGITYGDTIALMLPTSLDFLVAYMGILLVGAIPVPLYPPLRANQVADYIIKESKILHNAGARLLITFPQTKPIGSIIKNLIPELQAVITFSQIAKPNAHWQTVRVQASDPALIQYTSGSTGTPKGVLLSHANLLANTRASGERLHLNSADVAVSWLPLYHDMGLIGAWLGAMYHGFPLTLMSPLMFLTHPEQWLWTIHYKQATLSAGPNFAYELCLKKITEEMIEGLDLSSWRAALNGAEPIYASTLHRFTQKFSAYGFQAKTFKPVYGLAESTVGLLIPELEDEPLIDTIDRHAFAEQQYAAIADTSIHNHGSPLAFVSCGKPLTGHQVRIVNGAGELLVERQIGQLQFKGPSCMQGYYRQPDITQTIYHDGWMASGDLAYRVDDNYFIVGRIKDIIIKAGRNLHPPEIELLIGELEHVRQGCVIAFSYNDTANATERLVIVAETRLPKVKHAQLKQAMATTLVEVLSVAADEIVLIAPGIIPKTSSGKLQRSACKQAYLMGNLSDTCTPQYWKLCMLAMQGIAGKITLYFRNSMRLIYTLYAAAWLILFAPIWFSLMLVLPKNIALRTNRFLIRLYLRTIFCYRMIKNRQHLISGAVIYVANHASYLDSILMLAILPAGIHVVAKQELEKLPFGPFILDKLNILRVKRRDMHDSVAVEQRITQCLQQGHAVLIFPEATFSYATGIRAFKSGAFKIAAQGRFPLVPIAIRGSRTMLRSGQYLLTPTCIVIEVLPSQHARDDSWQEIARLRDDIRQKIALACGEKTIDMIRCTLPGN